MQSVTEKSLTWYNLVRPTPAQLAELQKQYGFHELDIEDCLSEHERPKIDEYEQYVFIVLHIPYFSQEKRRIMKEEVNVFLGANYVITLSDGNLAVLNTLWQQVQASPEARKHALGEGAGFFLYELASLLFTSLFPLIDATNRELRELEGMLFEGEGEEQLLRIILELKRKIIALRRVLLPQRTLVAELEHKTKKFVPEELNVYFDDVQDAVERQWAVLETDKEVIETLQDTHESWVRTRTNKIIRVLTIFSVTMLPLTVITGLFGMNVPIPYATEAWTFSVISFLLFGFLVTTLGYFAFRKWF